MKECKEMRECISLYIDDELGLHERLEFEEHIASCSACKNELDEIMQIVDVCRNMPEEELPVNFKEELHKKLLDASEQSAAKSKILFFQSKYFKLLSSVAAVFLLVFLIKGLFDLNFFVGSKTGNMADRSYSKLAEAQSAAAENAALPEIQADAGDNSSQSSDMSSGAEASKDSYGTANAAIAPATTGDQNVTAEASAGNDRNDSTSAATARVAEPKAENKLTIAAAGILAANIVQNHTNLAITADDPMSKVEIIKNMASKYDAAEQAKKEIAGEGSGKTLMTAGTAQVELNFIIPMEQYTAFLNELTSAFGQANIVAEEIVTEDMTARVDEFVRQTDALDLKIAEQEKAGADSNSDEINKLKADKAALQNEIDALRQNTNSVLVKIVINKPVQ